MESGWIKLHRRLREKGFYNKPNYLAVWIELLLSANHEDNECLYNNETITVKKGQCIISQKKISKKFRIGLATVNRILKHLENENQIGKQTNNRFTLISITNWDKYQMVETQAETKRKPSGNQAETNKKNKKNKNKEELKNRITHAGAHDILKIEEEILHELQIIIQKEYPEICKLKTQLTFENAKKLYDTFDIKSIHNVLDAMENKKDLLSKYKSVYLTINNWCKNEQQRTRKPKTKYASHLHGGGSEDPADSVLS